jgi:hypothetical protein
MTEVLNGEASFPDVVRKTDDLGTMGELDFNTS